MNHIIITFLAVFQINSLLSADPSLISDSRFTTGGLAIFNTASTYGTFLTQYNQTISITYNQALSFVPSPILSFSRLKVDYSGDQRILFNNKALNVDQSSFDWQINVPAINLVQKLQVRYLMVSSEMMPNAFHVFEDNTDFQFDKYDHFILDITDQVNPELEDLRGLQFMTFISIQGCSVKPGTNNHNSNIDFYVYVDYPSASSTTIVKEVFLHISSILENVFSQLLYYNIFVLTMDINNNNPDFFVVFNQMKIADGQTSCTQASAYQFNYDNAIIGFAAFEVINQKILNFGNFIEQNYKFTGFGTQIEELKFDILIFQFMDCGGNTPLMVNDSGSIICYDVCPQYYYLSSDNFTCQPCAYDCGTCDNSFNCTQCSALTYRSLDNSTMRCTPIQGYFQNNRTIAQECLIDQCTQCISTTTCSQCQIGYYLNDGGQVCSACTIDDCLSCEFVNGAEVCNNCSGVMIVDNGECFNCTGGEYYLYDQSYDLSFTCVASCPPYYVQNSIDYVCEQCQSDCASCSLANISICQTCHASRTMDNSTGRCLPSEGYFQSNQPQATACIQNCQTCINNVTCDTCFDGYINSTCQLNCSSIASCLDCSMNGFGVICIDCGPTLTYDVNTGKCRVCYGNNPYIDDNGECWSQCPARYYTINYTCEACDYDCYRCHQAGYCYKCLPADNRKLQDRRCGPMEGYYENNLTVAAQCMHNCMRCNSSSYCNQCIQGYVFNMDKQLCEYGCGNGMIKDQDCDDGNSVGGDGCSSGCQVQQYFVCNQTDMNGSSLCYLVELAMQRKYLVKIEGENKISIAFELSPSSMSLYNSLPWTDLFSSSHPNTSPSSHTYDSSTNLLQLLYSYNSSIEGFQTQLSFSNPNISILKYMTPFTVRVSLVADDNQYLEVYDDDSYLIAEVVGYLGYLIDGLAVLLFLGGIVAGKLVALEFGAIVQLTFYSLISLDGMSPSYYSLTTLKYSNGYNYSPSYSYSSVLSPNLKSLQISPNFTQNYNIMCIFILIPLLIAIISKILIKTKYKGQQNKYLNMVEGYCFREYAFYGLMFGGYCGLVSIVVMGRYWGDVDVGILDILLAVFYMLLYAVYFGALCVAESKLFGEFKSKFLKFDVSQKYYNLVMIEKLLSAVLLVVMIGFLYTAGIIAVILGLMIGFILTKKSYVGQYKSLRPSLNLFAMIGVLGCMVTSNIFQSKSNFYQIYSPLLIILLLLIAGCYSIYYFILELKEAKLKYQNYKQQKRYNEQDVVKEEFSSIKRAILGYHDKEILKSINQTFMNYNSIDMKEQWDNYEVLGDEKRKLVDNPKIKDPIEDIEASKKLGDIRQKIGKYRAGEDKVGEASDKGGI